MQFRRSTDLVAIVTGTLASHRAAGAAAGARNHRIRPDRGFGRGARPVLERLREHDIDISLDDFGTGFASLAYLNDFPFSKIKIDRKFSQGIDTSPRTAAIIGGIAKTTRDLHIELVAEGVETENQLERMYRFGINAMQGYLFCRPLPASEIRKVIVNPIITETAKRHAMQAAAAQGGFLKPTLSRSAETLSRPRGSYPAPPCA